jgi:outer membrane receptor for monomeric catechols
MACLWAAIVLRDLKGAPQTSTRKRKMEESKKKQIELKWRRMIEAANLNSEKTSRPNLDTPGEVTVIRRRKRRIVSSAA